MTQHSTALQTTRGRTKGLFTPDDTLWRIHRELLVMLAGSRALLLELAHPMIAAGVAQHSDFRRRPLHRLFNTLRVMQRLSFGDGDAVQKSAQRVCRCHHHVQGELTESTGSYHAGTAYDAHDVQLRLWVFATLIDSVLVVYDKFVKPLSDAERIAFYQDAMRMGRVLGIPSATMPVDYQAFAAYIDGMVCSQTLPVGDQAREVANALFSHPVFGLALWLISQPGIGMLPEPIRAAYGFHWSEANDGRLARFAAICRWLRARLPDAVCIQPEALLGEWRYQRS